MIILLLFSIIGIQAQQLVKVIGFISNGAITPPYFFNQSNWEGYKEEQLTNKGLQQMLILGQQASQKYGSLFQNKAGICKNESIQSFFRLYDINIKSGMSYLRGLCFSNDQQFFKYTFDTYLLPFISNKDVAINYTKQSDYVKFDIYDNIEDLVQGNEEYFETDDILVCPNIQQLLQNQINENITKTEITKWVPKIKKLSNTIINKNLTTYEQQVDAMFELRKRYLEYRSYKFAGQSVPYNLTPSIVLLYQINYFLSQYQVQLGSLELVQLQVSKIVSQILNFQTNLSKKRLLQSNTDSSSETTTTSSSQNQTAVNQTTANTTTADSTAVNSTTANITNATQNQTQNATTKSENSSSTTSSNSSSTTSSDGNTNEISNSTTSSDNKTNQNVTNTPPQNPDKPLSVTNQTQNQSNQTVQNQTNQTKPEPTPEPIQPKVDVDSIYTISSDGISLYFIDEVQFAAILKVFLTYQEIADLSYASIPQFAANIYLEYYKTANNFDVAIKYNGRVLRNLDQCPQETKQTCSMVDFTKLISQYAVDHLDLICQ